MNAEESEAVKKLIKLTRELWNEVRSLEGETPSSECADEFIAETIAEASFFANRKEINAG